MRAEGRRNKRGGIHSESKGGDLGHHRTRLTLSKGPMSRGFEWSLERGVAVRSRLPPRKRSEGSLVRQRVHSLPRCFHASTHSGSRDRKSVV